MARRREGAAARLTRATARRRLSEPGPDPDALLDFFAEVSVAMVANARSLGLTVLPVRHTDDVDVDALAEAVLRDLATTTPDWGAVVT